MDWPNSLFVLETDIDKLKHCQNSQIFIRLFSKVRDVNAFQVSTNSDVTTNTLFFVFSVQACNLRIISVALYG